MNFWRKLFHVEPVDYVMLKFHDEYRKVAVVWTSSGPFVKPYPSMDGWARLLPGGEVTGNKEWLREYVPITPRITAWSEVTARCLGIERKSA